MKKILTLNEISSVIYDHLDTNEYTIAGDVQSPDALLLRSAKIHDYEFNEELLCIGRAGAGTNNIPIERCSKDGIVVFNTPGANANGVKELVLCSLLMSGRKVIESIEWVKSQKCKGDDVPSLVEKNKSKFAGPEVIGKKLGIIGMGAIGGMVANVAIALGMEVTGYDPYMSIDSALGLTRTVKITKSLDKILIESDYITIHIPLNEKTKNLIGKDTIPKLKNNVIIMNFSRGGLVDNAALLSALDKKHIQKYITDFPTEDLLCRDDIITLPHLGASTPEAEDNCAAMAAMQIDDYIKNGNITNSVNLPACKLPRSSEIRLSLVHSNVKNMVGQITSALGLEDHNISNMINASRGEYAYTLIDVDDAPSDDCINILKKIDGMIKVRVI
ncbi:MAG: phosphoglycerate dehydrogenase [Clostridiales bacterium]|nr:phosphoglycerate dehydrogenase [Clostridiales bacterium]